MILLLLVENSIYKEYILYSVHAKSLQLCLTLCDPMNYGRSGSSVHWLLQARYWSGLPRPSPGDGSNPGIEPTSIPSNMHWQAGYLPLAPHEKSIYYIYYTIYMLGFTDGASDKEPSCQCWRRKRRGSYIRNV